MEESGTPDAYWASISRDTAIRRLFPALKNANVDFGDMLPGRYWPRHSIPKKDQTPLDLSVQNLLQEGSKQFIKTSADLQLKGILCPFYTWRLMSAISVQNAGTTYKNLTSERMRALQAERDNWQMHIDSANRLIRSKTEIGLHYGSVYLNKADFDDERLETLREKRANRVADLRAQVKRDTEILRGLDYEISEVARISTRTKNGSIPRLWRMQVYFWMAALWRDMAVDAAGMHGVFLDVLSSITETISGGEHKIERWGQYKTADRVSKNLPFGEGLTIGTGGFFNCEEPEALSGRGQEVRDLIDYSKNDSIEQEIVTISHLALRLRDYSEGHLIIIARDLALRGAMRRIGWVSTRLRIQLGWIHTPEKHAVMDAIKRAMHSAKNGNAASAAVLQAAFMFDEWSREYINGLGWNEIFAGQPAEKVIAEFEASTLESVPWSEMTGDKKAFEAAIVLLSDCYEISIAAGNELKSAVAGNLWSDPSSPILKTQGVTIS